MSEVPGDELWEAEVGALLGALPEVDPPDGFIAAALDHRPLWAGRTLMGLAAAVVVATVAGLAVGPGGGRIVPEIDTMSARHLDAAARLEATDDPPGAESVDPPTWDIDGAPSAEPADSLVSHGYEPAATIDADDLRQAVYARDGEAVSVFARDGRLDWDRLSASGRTMFGSTEAWVDDDLEITIVETSDGIVTIVGLSSTEVAELVADLPVDESMLDRAEDLANEVARQLGFAG
jgi:hypothetical protein